MKFIVLFLFFVHTFGALTIQSPEELQGETFSWIVATFSAHLGTPGVLAPLVIPANATNHQGCDSLIPSEVSGKVVLLDRGGCAFVPKCQNVIDAGGVACLLANNQDGLENPSGAGRLSIPTLGITLQDGVRLRNFTSVYGQIMISIVQYPMHSDQKQALIDLYVATGGANWTTQGTVGNPPLGWANYTGSDPCQEPWQGISCNPEGTIRQMLLAQYAMDGTIPNSLAALDTVELCILSSNSLRGNLPPFFSSFSRLTQIDLSDNLLEGTLPQDWSKNIALTSVSMGANKFTGTIPESLFGLANLTDIAFGNLQLSGTLPHSLGQLINLQSLVLTSNLFEGQFPDVDLPQLNDVEIDGNSFTGSVPSIFGRAKLATLNIAKNKFTGNLPSSISNMTSLRYLDISFNSFSGVVPVPGPEVRYYIASHNGFTSLDTNLGTNCLFLSLVDFSYNNLTGPYTDFLSRLPAPTNAQVQDGQCLQYIDLSYNQISAPDASTFQADVSRWPLLVSISFKNNQLNNNLQFLFGSNNYLRTVDISDNPVTGPIPATFASLPSLQNIMLTNTNLRYVGTFLPSPMFSANANMSTYFPDLNMNCPQIVTQFGAVVEVDQNYHAYELCRCEPGYRRKITTNTINPSIGFQCVACPNGLVCPGRDNDTVFSFDPFFYPTPSAEDPQALLPCSSCQPTAGTEFHCEKHHLGRMCSQCDDGFFWSGTACNKCVPLGSALLVCSVLLLVAALVGFALYSMFLRGLLCLPSLDPPLRTISTQSGEALVSVVKVAYEEPLPENSIDFSLKSMAAISIAINYYQTVSALSQYFSLPNSVISLLSASKILSSATGAGIGMACISSELNKYENLYTAVMLEPVVITAAIVVFYLLGRGVIMVMRRVPTVMQGWDVTCLTMLLFAINFLFFPISSTAINSFRCTEDPITKISYNSAYPYALCSGISLGRRVAALLLYVGGIMGLFSGLVVLYNRSTHGEKWHHTIGTSFGFFFLHYRKKYNMSAILVLIRRFVLSLLISLIRVNTVLSFGLVSAILVISISYNIFIQPFKSQRDNYLETVTILAAFFAYTLAFTLSLSELDYGALPIVVFYFLVNVGVVVWCAIEFLRGQLPKLKELLIYLRLRGKQLKRGRVGTLSMESRNSDSGSSTSSMDW